MRKDSDCRCALDFRIHVGGDSREEYLKARRLFNKGRHPAFVGPDMVQKNARNGGLLFFVYRSKSVGVAVINAKKGVLLALNILPEHRSHGLGSAVINYLMPNFARVTEQASPWFESQGYKKVGKWMMGRKLMTCVMVRKRLFDLAGRLNGISQQGKLRCRSIPQPDLAWDGYRMSNRPGLV